MNRNLLTTIDYKSFIEFQIKIGTIRMETPDKMKVSKNIHNQKPSTKPKVKTIIRRIT